LEYYLSIDNATLGLIWSKVNATHNDNDNDDGSAEVFIKKLL